MHDIVIPAFQELGLRAEVDRLRSCGQYVYYIDCCNCHTKHFSGYTSCKSRWCLICNHFRVLKWVAKLVNVIDRWIENGGHVSMINFTVRDTDSLRLGIDSLSRAFRGIYNNTANRRYWKSRFPGGVRSLEVKKGKNSGKWHPHYHCLVLQPTDYEKDFYWLRERWKNLTGGEGSVWVKQVRGTNLLKSICETVKYILKPELSLYKNNDMLAEAWYVLKGVRQVNTWGVLRGIGKQIEDEIERESDVQGQKKKLTEFVCQRCGCTEGELVSILYAEAKEYLLVDF